MTKAETESLAKRYIRYLGMNIDTSAPHGEKWSVKIGHMHYKDIASFIVGQNAIYEWPFNDRVRQNAWGSGKWRDKIIAYSSAEELDFKLSAMGF